MAGEALSKSQADRLGEALRHGEISADLIERLSAYREYLVSFAKDVAEAVRSLTLYPVTPREGKSTQSIVAKLRRQPIALSRMQDIVGCRIVVDTIVEQEALYARIKARFPDARLADRRKEPSFGYRAVHFILKWESFPYEIQLRTRSQHAWAQTVERLSDLAYPDLKYGNGPENILYQIRQASVMVERLEALEIDMFRNPDKPRDSQLAANVLSIRSVMIEYIGNLASSEII